MRRRGDTVTLSRAPTREGSVRGARALLIGARTAPALTEPATPVLLVAALRPRRSRRRRLRATVLLSSRFFSSLSSNYKPRYAPLGVRSPVADEGVAPIALLACPPHPRRASRLPVRTQRG